MKSFGNKMRRVTKEQNGNHIKWSVVVCKIVEIGQQRLFGSLVDILVMVTHIPKLDFCPSFYRPCDLAVCSQAG